MKYFYGLLLLLQMIWGSCTSQNPGEGSVKETMDGIVSRFYEEFNKPQLDTIGNDFILQYLSEEEKNILASKYWTFEVNVSVTVSLMRDIDQKTLPYWLKETGFKKTGLEVKNTHSDYEVWQKNYDAGRVNLGINGFDKHRPVYFISVGPQDENDKLKIKPVVPARQHFEIMKEGSFTYHDWSGLTLTEVPKELAGQVLFTTIRGRAREAHLIEAFRETDFPSSEKPDQILLTWSNDPTTTIDIQWRGPISIDQGQVKYWIKGTQDTLTSIADKFVMEDRLLQNDRFVHRFIAKLTNLHPGTSYEYLVNHGEGNSSEIHTFLTENNSLSPFSFVLMIDVTLPIEEQTDWVEKQLSSSEADWKFAMFHFPPYNSIGFYQEIIDEWGPFFDQYHVDMVMSGHFHYYMRSKPLSAGKVVSNPADGTLYVMSIGTSGKNKDMKEAPYAELQFGGEYLYQHVEIDGRNLRYTSYDLEGEIRDNFVINK
jgi:hypothetical protein